MWSMDLFVPLSQLSTSRVLSTTRAFGVGGDYFLHEADCCNVEHCVVVAEDLVELLTAHFLPYSGNFAWVSLTIGCARCLSHPVTVSAHIKTSAILHDGCQPLMYASVYKLLTILIYSESRRASWRRRGAYRLRSLKASSEIDHVAV